jgi:glycosyltransferase involved in cell wall biosynthesis
MRLAALVESPDHVCCRYRLGAFRASLAAVGHELSLTPLPRFWWERLRTGADLRDADAVVLQRKLLSRLEIGLLRSRVRKLFLDFDDAVWLRDSYSVKGHASGRRLRRFRATVSRCDAVIAGNAFLAEQAERWSGGPVRIIPTCVDTNRYPVATHDRLAGTAQLVWIGSSSTLKGLDQIRPLLEQVGAVSPGASMKLICDRFLKLRNMPVIDCQWSEATEAQEIAAADLGISWVPDDPWSRGKCGLKVLQYMAAGLPVVANPVGVQAEMVRDGETGFHARTPDEWVEAVRTLAADPDLRRRMGRAGRTLVEEKYSIPAGTQQWLGLLDQLGRRRVHA